MAYKFQIGDARLSGSLVQEGGITAAGNLDDSATVSGSAFTVDLGGLSIDGTAVGCTAAELNFNDGATAGTVVASKTVVVDANKDADGFRNISGSGTINADVGTFSGAVTAGTSFIIGSADMSEADLEKLDGITNGTVAASKAVVVDANKDADGFRNISGSGTAEFDVGTFSGAVTAGTSFIIGSADMSETDLEKLDGITNGTVAANKAVVVDGSKDADGFRNISGSGTAEFDIGTFSGAVTAGTSFIIGSADMNETDLEKLDGITNGTVAANKAVVVDANKDADGFRNISGSGTINADVGTFSGAVTAGTSFVIGSADMNETDLEKLDGITNGTVAANKAVVVNANKDAGDFRNILMAGKLGTATDQEYVNFGTSNQIEFAINDTVEATVTAQGFVVTNGLLVGAGESIDVSSAGALNIGDTDANAITIGSSGITTTIAGNLTVQGTTTTVDSTTINISSSFTFEGPADDFETTLSVGTPIQDIDIVMPEYSSSAGSHQVKMAVLASGGTAADYLAGSLVTAAEFKQLDGSAIKTAGYATATIDDSNDAFLFNDNGTIRHLRADQLKTYIGEGTTNVNSGSNGGTLAVGINYFDLHYGAISANCPASSGLSNGDKIIIKAGPDCSSTNTLTINAAGSQTFDTVLTSVVLESPNAAITLLVVDQGNDDLRII